MSVPGIGSEAIDGRCIVVEVGGTAFGRDDFVMLFDGTSSGWRLADDGPGSFGRNSWGHLCHLIGVYIAN
jgi:hypothetical protein